MALYFITKDCESCFDIEGIKSIMKIKKLKKLTVFKARRMIHHDYFYCKHFGIIGEVGEGCGKDCNYYIPLNGKSGRCKHYGFCYENTEETKTIKL